MIIFNSQDGPLEFAYSTYQYQAGVAPGKHTPRKLVGGNALSAFDGSSLTVKSMGAIKTPDGKSVDSWSMKIYPGKFEFYVPAHLVPAPVHDVKEAAPAEEKKPPKYEELVDDEEEEDLRFRDDGLGSPCRTFYRAKDKPKAARGRKRTLGQVGGSQASQVNPIV